LTFSDLDLPPSFCVILPMFNEEENAETCVTRVAQFLDAIPVRTGIIAVDDGSSDATGQILRRLARGMPGLVVVIHQRNQGYGAANRTGFSVALRDGYDYALVMDADCTQHPDGIAAFFDPMRRGVEMIKATRYAKGGRVEGVPWHRLIVSWAGNRLARVVINCGLTDFTNGFRAIHRRLLCQLSTTESGFAMLMEEVRCAYRLGATFDEVPYTLTVRSAGGGKSKFIYSWPVYRKYLAYLFGFKNSGS